MGTSGSRNRWLPSTINSDCPNEQSAPMSIDVEHCTNALLVNTVRSPIVGVGSARSGTTLLQSALGAHAHIAAPPEMYFVTRISSLADYYGDLRDDGALGRALRATLDFVLLEPVQLDEEELLVEAKGGPRTYGSLLTT